MNSAPNSQPIRHRRRHWRGRPSEKIRVNSGGISRYSATTFTPPSEMSVTMQSRGKPPVPNCIFARLLQIRRSLLRRFAANISILPRSMPTHPVSVRLTEQSLEYAELKLSQSIVCFRIHFINSIQPSGVRAFQRPKTGLNLPLPMQRCVRAGKPIQMLIRNVEETS
jgi:hypothetical protein